MEEKKNRTAIYIRVSTNRQVKEGESLEAQEDALIKYAKDHNLKVIDKYIEYGESGQKMKRTALTRLLEDVKKNKIDIIILTKLDRWFRSVKDFYKVQEIISEHNVNWKTIWEDYDTTTANGRFQLNVMLSLGELEAQRTAERIYDTFNYKYEVQKTVCSGSKKFGWDIIDKKYVINEQEAELRKQSLEKLIETQSLAKTVKWYQLNVRNIKYDQIKRELKDSAVIGKFINEKGNEIKDFIPPIVSEELYYKAQEVFKNNIKIYPTKAKEKHLYIFSGLLKCGCCNHKISGSRNKEKYYYRCKHSKKNNIENCNNSSYINEEYLEEYALNFLKNNFKDRILKIENKKSKQNIQNIDNTTKIKTQMNKLTDLYMNDLINIDYYKKEYEILKEQLEKEENKKRTLEIDTTKFKQLIEKDISKSYNQLKNDAKIRFWRDIITEITISSKDEIDIKTVLD